VAKDYVTSIKLTHTHTHTNARTHTHAHTHININTRTHAHMHTRTHLHTCTHTHTCTLTHTQQAPMVGRARPAWQGNSNRRKGARRAAIALRANTPSRLRRPVLPFARIASLTAHLQRAAARKQPASATLATPVALTAQHAPRARPRSTRIGWEMRSAKSARQARLQTRREQGVFA
jgi:hypothetical protein